MPEQPPAVVGREMRDYYDRRAREYDEWWLGEGQYASLDRPGWHQEVDRLTSAVAGLPPARWLDVACGTGFLTRHLPGEVTGLDQSGRMLAIARERVPAATFVLGDALDLPFEDGTFERLFTSYFYCHLEEADRLRFLAEAHRVADELIVMASRPGDADEPLERWEERRLQDDSRWRVYKRVFEPESLTAELGGSVLHAGRWFVVVRA